MAPLQVFGYPYTLHALTTFIIHCYTDINTLTCAHLLYRCIIYSTLYIHYTLHTHTLYGSSVEYTYVHVHRIYGRQKYAMHLFHSPLHYNDNRRPESTKVRFCIQLNLPCLLIALHYSKSKPTLVMGKSIVC